MTAHAVLGASSAHRWMACPGSIRLSADVPDSTSYYAAEGTAAHELADRCLRNGFDTDRFIDETIVVGNDTFVVTDEMAEAVQVYLDAVREEMLRRIDTRGMGELLVETRFDLSSLHPGMFGTNDACVYHREIGRLVVFDYKHGRGHAVEAKGNPQLLYYAYGAAIMAGDERPLTEIEMVIVQPRAPHRDGPIRRWTVSAFDLLEWSVDLVAAARATEAPDAPLKPGDHCLFCKAAGFCPALKDQAVEAARLEFSDLGAETLSDAMMADILAQADLIDVWVNAVRARAIHVLEQGGAVPGWKLVEKRATRKWRGEFPIDELHRLGLNDDQLYDRRPLSVAKVEKLLPKANREALAALTVKESSGLTLAPEGDARPARGRAADDFTAL